MDVDADAGEDLRVPVGEALPGVMLPALEEGAEVEFVFALVKYRDEDGVGWAYRASGPPNREELLGVLQVQRTLLLRELCDEWEDD